MTQADLVRTSATLIILAAIFALGVEVYLVRRVWLLDKTVVALRERLVAASLRLTAAIIGAFVMFEALYHWHLFGNDTAAVLVGLALSMLAVPSVRFIWLFSHHGFDRRDS